MDRYNKRQALTISCVFLSVFLTACGGPYPDMSNYDLQEALWKCKSLGDGDMTPAMGVKCTNVKRECSVRKKDGLISTC